MADGGVDATDWDTIWQSELAALAMDRECRERFLLWGQAWVAAGDGAAGRPGTDAPTGPATAGPAPDAEQLERLRHALAGLGQRA